MYFMAGRLGGRLKPRRRAQAGELQTVADDLHQAKDARTMCFIVVVSL